MPAPSVSRDRPDSRTLFPVKPRVTVRWIVHHKCNLRCRHCSYFGSSSERRESLDPATARKVLANLTDGSVILANLQFVGGEPLLRDDLPDLAGAAAAAGVSVEVVTNGTLIDDRSLDLLKQGTLASLCVSIDGIDKATYGQLRDPGVYDTVLANLQRAVRGKSGKTRVRVNYVLTRQTLRPPLDIVSHFAAMGCDILTLSFVQLEGAARDRERELSPSVEEKLAFIEAYYLRLAEYGIETSLVVPPLVLHYLNVRHGLDLPLRYNGCPAVTGEWAVTSDGQLDPCARIMRTPEVRSRLSARRFSIRDHGFGHILSHPSVARILESKGAVPYHGYRPCRDCRFLHNWCEPCFIEGLAGTGGVFGLCLAARARLADLAGA